MIDRIMGTTEAWETGRLGQDEQYAQVADIDTSELDAALGLQPITLRMSQDLIADLEDLAVLHGLKGSQPLIRRVLSDYVLEEKGRLQNVSADESDD
ncbi:hypothetical protein [Nitrincola alkalilacustris]|uniref:hypothetical protein n=1 Tax=Nitrincola alkalilacustris TaxID=1571224 RepID=UPI00198173D4|nr:hypothetical protein [Nitrincola alkalilacustris]